MKYFPIRLKYFAKQNASSNLWKKSKFNTKTIEKTIQGIQLIRLLSRFTGWCIFDELNLNKHKNPFVYDTRKKVEYLNILFVRVRDLIERNFDKSIFKTNFFFFQ